jgi:hypothetical protein
MIPAKINPPKLEKTSPVDGLGYFFVCKVKYELNRF